jgi:hypothetical protein
MDRVYWNTPAAGVNSYGAAVNGSVTIQRNVGLTADPPGYCGAAFFVATDTMVNTSNYGH